MRKKNFLKTIIAVIMLLVCFFPANFKLSNLIVNAVEDNRSAYSKVLDDLKIDENFKVDDYPDVEDDYSLQVIQVAETKGGEVLIYCYQPAAKTKALTATKISLSTAILDNYSPKVYDLTLLNSEGVFQKYRVDGLTVKSDVVRYYEISEIFRAWDKDIDSIPLGENITTQKAISVGERWTACTLEGQVYYNCEKTEVVEITNMFVGFVEYPAGQNFMTWLYRMDKACQSHFIAFNSDHEIDELLEADVIFTRQERFYLNGSSVSSDNTFKNPVTETITLNHTDETTVDVDTKFSHQKYSWKNIQTPTEFFNSVEGRKVYEKGLINVTGKTTLVESDKNIINNMQYVLRFYESEFSEETTGISGITFTKETAVTDVAILRLKFKYQGKTYNLGVVGDMQTGSGKSSSITDWSIELDKTFEKILLVIGIVVALVGILIILNLLGWLAPVLKFIGIVLLKVGKFLWLIISSPFVFIKSMFKKE